MTEQLVFHSKDDAAAESRALNFAKETAKRGYGCSRPNLVRVPRGFRAESLDEDGGMENMWERGVSIHMPEEVLPGERIYGMQESAD